MTRRSIETSIDIRADAETVWQVLTDFSAYPDWNPFVRSIDGEPAEDNRLSVMIHPPRRSFRAAGATGLAQDAATDTHGF